MNNMNMDNQTSKKDYDQPKIIENSADASKPDVEIVLDNIEGKVLNDRYKIERFLDMGGSGEVYKAIDVKNDGGCPLVVKVLERSSKFKNEIQNLLKINELKIDLKEKSKTAGVLGKTPEIIDYGKFLLVDS